MRIGTIPFQIQSVGLMQSGRSSFKMASWGNQSHQALQFASVSPHCRHLDSATSLDLHRGITQLEAIV